MTQESSQKRLSILVEGRTDKAVVGYLLDAMGSDMRKQVEVQECGGKNGVKAAYRLATSAGANLVALVDADESSVLDAEAWARTYFETASSNVFCAVPTIEAWIFADKELALRHARPTPYAKSSIGRLVTPESLINVKHLVNQIFDREIIDADFPFLREINLGRAVGSSASMFRFLQGVDRALGNSWPFAEQKLSNELNRKVFANLLREIPSQTIGWKTLTGKYTAEQLGDSILKGDEVGLRYISDLLRLARDILAARALPSNEQNEDA